ncbi:MAG TPA: NUDIX hydrolase [Candidatus Methylomirabilis sp.]|nr:NUDIX hydrolase [Candidatus Methylomirabilis sp.]
MSGRFEWREVTTEYRDVLASPQGDELRWLVNRARIRDTVTGKTVTRSIMRSPGVCVMVPILSDDRILLLRQYRFPVGGELWELPAGTIEGREEGGRAVPTESPEACAARELIEETGYEAGVLARVAEWYAMPGGHDLRVYLFAARRLVRRAQRLDDGEVILEVRPFTAPEVETMIARGEIQDAKTLAGLLHTLGRRPGGIHLPS